ncbi:MAG: Gx transporter family protein [Lachnospiraceae bacterium]|nr:Gx transporter family protein [Lachnospiraceae bacterium]
MRKSQTIALYGVLTALALVFGYIESVLPVFVFVPGMKLGLSNILVVFALYRLGDKSAMAINLIRIVISSMLFGNVVSLIYSLAGGMLSTIVMIILKHINVFNIVTVSVVGGICHNVGQIIAAAILMSTSAIMYYLAVLWISGMVFGALIGLLAGVIVRRIPYKLTGGGL